MHETDYANNWRIQQKKTTCCACAESVEAGQAVEIGYPDAWESPDICFSCLTKMVAEIKENNTGS